MPEFPGYVGAAQRNLPVLRVTAITHRVNPIFQILVGPGEEHVTLTGLPTEASIYRLIEDAMPGFLQNVYCHPAGGGKYLAILQVKKRQAERRGAAAPGGAGRVHRVLRAEARDPGGRRRRPLRLR